MKKIYVFFVLILIGCQNKNSNGINAKVINNDFQLYKLCKYKNKFCVEYSSDTLIELYIGPRLETYIEKKILKNNYYEKAIYTKKCKVVTNGYWFSEAKIGVHNYYDEKGSLKNQIDFDDGFIITINKLRKIILSKYKIDINNYAANNIEIYKEKEIFNSSYIIKIRVGTYDKIIKINGNTGKIISEEELDIGEG